MRILFLGTPEFAVPPLEALHNGGHEIVLVVTRPDAARGRGRKRAAPPVGSAGLRLALPLYQPQSANAPGAAERMRAAGADVGVVVAYGELLGSDVLAVPEKGFLNLHASLLPRYRGAAPINWAILRGEEVTGVTVQRMSRQLDAGAILAQESVVIGDDDTAGDLHDRLCECGAALLLRVLDALGRRETLPEVPQDPSEATYAPKLTKKDGRIDWHQTAAAIRNRVRGLTPWPGASCRFIRADASEDVILVRVAGGPRGDEAAAPGTVLCAGDREGIVVQTGQDTVTIEQLKPASGRVMTAADFMHGRHVESGDRFA